MHLVFTGPHLTEPTYETFVEHSEKKFKSLQRILNTNGDFEHEVRISASKSGDEFEVKAEVKIPEVIIAKAKDRDLRRAIDEVKDRLRDQIKSTLEKKRA